MQRFIVSVVCGSAALFSTYTCYRLQGENNTLKMSQALYESENRLLKDQLRENEHKATSSRTYEEGLTDGLVRSNNIGYTDGYHAAMNQVSEQKAIDEAKKKTNQ
jgi:hypothetical protein